MIILRKAKDRGFFQNEWLRSYHTFSFSEYYDPRYMHFNHLRVINEDYIAPNTGFPFHHHQDMEIMTYIISGELSHKDDMGNSSTIKAGEVQFMRAGEHVTHSEFNASKEVPVHLLQIWILPNKKGLKPTYFQSFYSIDKKQNQLCLLASPRAHEDAFQIAQNVEIYASVLDSGASLEYGVEVSTEQWIQVVRGSLQLNTMTLFAGDGAGIKNEAGLSFMANEETEFLLFVFYT